MKKAALTLILILTILPLTLVGVHTIQVANANFYAEATTLPPQGTIPPTITVTNSENQNVTQLQVNIASASCPTKYSSFSLPRVYYKGDWMTNESFADYGYTLTLPLNNASSGTHIVIVRAEQGCFYENEDGVPYYFRTNSSIVVKFIIEDAQPFYAKILATFDFDISLPNVSVLSLENNTFVSSIVPLEFTVNDLVTQISYSLDGQNNVTIAGNTTLTGLSNGAHNVTVYYTDIVGKAGASETAYFNVDIPSPTSLVVAASGTLTGIAAVGVLVYFKRHKREAELQ
jgi:hypothetical protein